MRVSLVIPVHNEARIIARSIRTIAEHFDDLPLVTTLTLVDDGSTDGTAAVIDQERAALGDDRIRRISHSENRGYGAALRTGAARAIEEGADYVIFLDSDLTNHPKYLTLFYERMNEGWDYIKASRHIAGSAVVGVPPLHRWISSVGNSVARKLMRVPITDCTNGFRAVRTSLLARMSLQDDGFPIIIEELVQARDLGASFVEVPYTLTTREANEGSSHLSYGPKMCYRYLRHALR
jgi:dolichol-phosphate mannosyltransferase